MRWASVIVGILVLAGSFASGPARAGDRIQWRGGEPSIFFRHISAPGPSGNMYVSPRTLLMAQLQGRLLSFSERDTVLYAVFLRSAESLPALGRLLSRPGGRSLCLLQQRIRRCPGQLGISGPIQRVRLESNGLVTVDADEGEHPGADFLAVINGAGEILGARPVWSAPERRATIALNEASPAR